MERETQLDFALKNLTIDQRFPEYGKYVPGDLSKFPGQHLLKIYTDQNEEIIILICEGKLVAILADDSFREPEPALALMNR
jgi:hypothetical protein